VCCIFPRFQQSRLLDVVQIEAAWSSIILLHFLHTKSLHIPTPVIVLPIYLTTRHHIQLPSVLLPIYQTTGYHVQLAIILLLVHQTTRRYIQLTSVLLTVCQYKRHPVSPRYNLVIHHWDNLTSNVIGYRSARSWRPGQ
jgi:hypothetical protein